MPQTWITNWPLPDADRTDPVKELKASQRRDRLLNTLGNLTLVTDSLHPTLSNSAWPIKRPELLKYGKLNLTQYFHAPEIDTWDETAIEKRTGYLFEHMIELWPELPATSSRDEESMVPARP